MAHENNVTKRYKELFPKSKKDFWYNEPKVRSAKHPTKYNKRYLKKFKTREDAEREAKSISKSTPHGYLAGGLLYPGVRLAVKYARPLWKVATQKIYKRAGETTMSKLQIKLDKARDLQSHFSKKQLKNLTSAKIKEMGKVLPKLNAYRDKIKATAKAWLEKEYRYGKSKKVLHSEGGEVVVHHNVDRSLL